jgi:hypothetical protein
MKIEQTNSASVPFFSSLVRQHLKLSGKYYIISSSVAEPHHFYAVPAPGENFDAAPAAPAAPAPTPTLLFNKAKFLKGTIVETHVETIFSI